MSDVIALINKFSEETKKKFRLVLEACPEGSFERDALINEICKKTNISESGVRTLFNLAVLAGFIEEEKTVTGVSLFKRRQKIEIERYI